MRIFVPFSKIPKYRIPLMELMLNYGSSKMVPCSTGRKPVHLNLGETIPEPCKISQHLLWIFGANMSLFMFQETSMLPGGPGNCCTTSEPNDSPANQQDSCDTKSNCLIHVQKGSRFLKSKHPTSVCGNPEDAIWYDSLLAFPLPNFINSCGCFSEVLGCGGGGCSQQVWADGPKE